MSSVPAPERVIGESLDKGEFPTEAWEFTEGALTLKPEWSLTVTDETILGDLTVGGNQTVAGSLTVAGNLQGRYGTLGHLWGLTLSNGTDATNDIDIAAGEAVDNSDGTLMVASALTKQLDAAWAVGTNQGGLDTGAIANAWYAVWLIKNPTTSVVDALFSLSATAPTMPAGYTKKRRIGWICRSGGAILAFYHDTVRDYFGWKTRIESQDTTAANPGALVAVDGAPSCVAEFLLSTTSANGQALGVFEANETAQTPSSTYNVTPSAEAAASTAYRLRMFMRLNSARQVFIVSASGTPAYAIYAIGWIDTRGRLA